jgi:hypothetical protein
MMTLNPHSSKLKLAQISFGESSISLQQCTIQDLTLIPGVADVVRKISRRVIRKLRRLGY